MSIYEYPMDFLFMDLLKIKVTIHVSLKEVDNALFFSFSNGANQQIVGAFVINRRDGSIICKNKHNDIKKIYSN